MGKVDTVTRRRGVFGSARSGGPKQNGFDNQGAVGEIAESVGKLGIHLAKVGGVIDEISRDVTGQTALFAELSSSTDAISEGNSVLRADAEALLGVAETVDAEMAASQGAAERSRIDVTGLADWIKRAGIELQTLNTAMSSISGIVGKIDAIAQQTHILALNARIEAMRAGEHGVGFVVIADSVRDLSDQTIAAASVIAQTISPLISSVKLLGDSSQVAQERASEAQDSSSKILASVQSVKSQVDELTSRLHRVAEFSETTASNSSEARSSFSALSNGLTANAQKLVAVTTEVGELTSLSENLITQAVLSGVETPDTQYVALATQGAAEISERFEQAVHSGKISESYLFDEDYVPIPGSDPVQHMTKFTRLTDELLPPIQEAILNSSDRIVFAATVDLNGYLPTHNLKFSKPQGSDPVWNNANCRNRRIFGDRTGLGAAKSTRPFYVQTYRRDMGGGTFVMMKDVSAPIWVNGRHWGALRVAYSVS